MMEFGPPELNLIIIQEVEDSTIVITEECYLGIDHIFFHFRYLTLKCFQPVKFMKLVFKLINI